MRPEYLRYLINDQLAFKSMSVWSIEALLQPTIIGIYDQLPNYAFETPKHEFDKLYKSCLYSNLKLRDPKYWDLFGNQFETSLFEKGNSTYRNFPYGLYSARNIFMLEASVLTDASL